jgi:hypothetical protein
MEALKKKERQGWNSVHHMWNPWMQKGFSDLLAKSYELVVSVYFDGFILLFNGTFSHYTSNRIVHLELL